MAMIQVLLVHFFTRSTSNVSIFVGNLPFRVEQEDVVELFAQFGEVVNCALPLERDTGRNDSPLWKWRMKQQKKLRSRPRRRADGRPLRINKAEPRGSAPRRGGGGYGGGGGGYGGGGGGGYGGGGGGGYGGGGGGYAAVAAVMEVVVVMAAVTLEATVVPVPVAEDRSYGAGSRDASGEGGSYDDGRSRRRRGSSSSSGGGGDDYFGYGGAEG